MVTQLQSLYLPAHRYVLGFCLLPDNIFRYLLKSRDALHAAMAKRSLKKLSKLEILYWTIILCVTCSFAGLEFYQLFQFYLYDSVATKIETVGARGEFLTENVFLSFCSPHWINRSRIEELNISNDLLEYMLSYLQSDAKALNQNHSETSITMDANSKLNHHEHELSMLLNDTQVTKENLRSFYNSIALKQDILFTQINSISNGSLQIVVPDQISYAFSQHVFCTKQSLRDVPISKYD